LRSSSSQPLFVHYALTALRDATEEFMATWSSNCDFLAAVADERGAVPYLLPSAKDDARAET